MSRTVPLLLALDTTRNLAHAVNDRSSRVQERAYYAVVRCQVTAAGAGGVGWVLSRGKAPRSQTHWCAVQKASSHRPRRRPPPRRRQGARRASACWLRRGRGKQQGQGAQRQPSLTADLVHHRRPTDSDVIVGPAKLRFHVSQLVKVGGHS